MEPMAVCAGPGQRWKRHPAAEIIRLLFGLRPRALLLSQGWLDRAAAAVEVTIMDALVKSQTAERAEVRKFRKADRFAASLI